MEIRKHYITILGEPAKATWGVAAPPGRYLLHLLRIWEINETRLHKLTSLYTLYIPSIKITFHVVAIHK
jgi:hypothetical protein